jgi:hypothetical protein
MTLCPRSPPARRGRIHDEREGRQGRSKAFKWQVPEAQAEHTAVVAKPCPGHQLQVVPRQQVPESVSLRENGVGHDKTCPCGTAAAHLISYLYRSAARTHKRCVISMRGQPEMAGMSFLQLTNDQSQQNAADRSLAIASCCQTPSGFSVLIFTRISLRVIRQADGW